MKVMTIALLLALSTASYADVFYKQYIYKCVKDGNTTFQEMPCGWSASGGHAGSNEQKGAVQYLVPMADFCNDKTISEQDTLKKDCIHFVLPKESK
ncbi:MAG: hypothetical protein P4L70_05965 [Parasulfuritortus sp.]|nr:hypothetical protein [Parasulfuritortus sp.]